MAMQGEIAGIARRQSPGSPMSEAETCRIEIGNGLEADHRTGHPGDHRSVVLVFEKQWEETCRDLGRELPWIARRGNLLVRGMENPGEGTRQLHIGADVVLETTGICDPCARMDRECRGLRSALDVGGRGGLTARVLAGGEVCLGDAVRLVEPAVLASGHGAAERIRGVLQFWFEEVPPEKRFRQDQGVDDAIRDRFAGLREEALAGSLASWEERAEGALALLVLLDQFSRNLFRGGSKAFEADYAARALADRSIARGHDLGVEEGRRMFFYLPFMHSESLADQDRCIALFESRLPNQELGLYHARKHREVIERFGRFPHRNAAMGREPTPAEVAFLAGGGYVP